MHKLKDKIGYCSKSYNQMLQKVITKGQIKRIKVIKIWIPYKIQKTKQKSHENIKTGHKTKSPQVNNKAE